MQNIEQPPFGKIRSFLWPIYGYELKKLIPMFALFFLISFVYNLLRCMKISLIVKAPGSGAEVIPFLKIGAVLPGALVLTWLFTKLINRFHREHVFYAMLSVFLGYFAIFIFYLYPNSEALRLDAFADLLGTYVFTSDGFKGFLAIIRHWNLSLFYVLSEMWSAVVLSMLFWGFANEVTKVHEAKRFYAIFALGANCSGMISGKFAMWIQTIPFNPNLPLGPENQWVYLQLITVLGFGVCIVALFYWLNRSVFHLENMQSLQIPKKSRQKLSLSECFSYLRTSRYTTYILVLVVAYNIVYNLADVMWTYKVEQIYANSKDVNSYMNQITFVTGFVATVFAFVISGNALRHYGWTIAALITPLIWLFTSLGFFPGLIFEAHVGDVLATFVANPANFILLLGSIQICFGRACKYTVFDETKEIAFIPLPKENQRKGKAVVDGIASRFGKSGGSLIYLMLFMVLGDIAYTIPYVSAIIFVMIGLWFVAVFGLGKMVNATIDEEQEIAINEVGEDKEKASIPPGKLTTAH